MKQVPFDSVFRFEEGRVAVIIETNGSKKDITPKGKTFSLKEMQEVVGGYVELVDLGEALMLVDEDGRAKSLKPNALATRMAESAGKLLPGTHILGTVLVMKRGLMK